MAVRENVGSHLDLVAYNTFDGEATTVDFRHNTVYDHPAWAPIQVRLGMIERGTSLGARRLLWNPSACQRVGNHHFTLQTCPELAQGQYFYPQPGESTQLILHTNAAGVILGKASLRILKPFGYDNVSGQDTPCSRIIPRSHIVSSFR